MNVQMGDLREALTPQPAKAEPAAAEQTPEAKPSAAVDPMQWWNALTQQFGELAASAIKDAPAGPAATRGAAQPAAGASVKAGAAGARKASAARKQPAARRGKGAAPRPGEG
jgi:hypothetical protein